MRLGFYFVATLLKLLFCIPFRIEKKNLSEFKRIDPFPYSYNQRQEQCQPCKNFSSFTPRKAGSW
ncbi:hypothetical protein CH238_14550 [[Clostridium] leptum DSM 753]|uniref:Uncharacterized protein n=1 Tax=[Clostridium] leptum DSM 753 TaxID=428125 RepID=A0A855A1Y5_9FIRM|nr:hypothetical protein CH238_14550 [[Clostridium] leptum DSM 753]RGU00967.1 hypothetical protein DWW99_12470 [[Clostridium] leptum]